MMCLHNACEIFRKFPDYRGGVVFPGGREMKIFSTVFRDFGKNMVGKWYFQHKMVLVITAKNNEKSGFEIIKDGISIFRHLSKKSLF